MSKPGAWIWVLVAACCLVGTGASAHASSGNEGSDSTDARMWWFGFQLHGITDGGSSGLSPDSFEAYDSNEGTSFGWGTGFTLPITVDLFRGLGMRTALSMSYSGDPFDKAETQIAYVDQETGGGYERKYRTLNAFFGNVSLLFDVHYGFPLLFGTVKPYLGAGPGLFLNYVFSDLTQEEFEMLDNEYNDTNDPNNIDPYSVNLATGFNGYLGVNFKVSGTMHLNFEIGYDVAQMSEAPLLKSTDGYDVRRGAYLYSVFRLSSGLLFNF